MSLSADTVGGQNWWLTTDNMPPIDLAKAREKLGVSEEAFSTVPVGRTVVVEE